MSSDEYYEGQRLSLKGQTCTVRYIGPVEGKSGVWLGVEWDEPQRGKHNGTHEGKQYFQCRSNTTTSASFLRPNQSWDQPRTFLKALTEKYMMSTTTHSTGTETVYFSGKQAEEVGFSKFSERQAKLQGIHVLVLDRMRISDRFISDRSDVDTITALCAEISVLDLSGNLFESFGEVAGLCALFPKLRSLTLDGNRFTVRGSRAETTLSTVRSLGLSQTLLDDVELAHVLSAFPSVEKLEYADNELSTWSFPIPSAQLTALDLSNNNFASLSDIHHLAQHTPTLQTLILNHNNISSVGPNLTLPPTLTDLSISHNSITSWTFFNDLLPLQTLRGLRVTGNPLYTNLRSAEGKPLTSEDGYMLTIARMPQLGMLNYSKISDKERLNAETYYLGQIAVELGLAADEDEEARILAGHPRWRGLCEEYGEPSVQRRKEKEEIDPRSLAARLVTVEFQLAPDALPDVQQRSWRVEVPKSFDVYAVLGLVGKKLGVSPLSLTLVLETGERDPRARDSGYGGPEWWDSSDDEEESSGPKEEEWAIREVELVPGTRALGTYVDGREATIKVRQK